MKGIMSSAFSVIFETASGVETILEILSKFMLREVTKTWLESCD